ncbi:MAG: threonine/serine dehydratase [Alphaproteobacteria bacterium]
MAPTEPAIHEPTLADIEAAAARIAGQAVRTPLLESPALNRRVGGRVLVKAEMLQRTGSFKFRGAYNKLSQIPEDIRRHGVIAFSSGNHAQGVAAAAHLLGAPATIVMPSDAPMVKREGTASWGATIVTYDRRDHDKRETIAVDLLNRQGGTLISPFDDPDIIAGQGTVGLELVDQADVEPDAVVVPAGGGGLTAGVATAVAAKLPGVPIYTAEPEGYDDHARSFVSGDREAVAAGAESFCDALLAPRPGILTFAINKKRCRGGLVVSDAEVAMAMAVAFRDLKVVVEPGGAVALAAVLTGRIAAEGKTVAVVCSGGNVDAGGFAEILGAAPVSG